MSAGEIESLESGDQELCLLYIVLLLVLAGCVWRCCLAECRLQTAPHTAGEGGHCSWHRGKISEVSIKRINC